MKKKEKNSCPVCGSNKWITVEPKKNQGVNQVDKILVELISNHEIERKRCKNCGLVMRKVDIDDWHIDKISIDEVHEKLRMDSTKLFPYWKNKAKKCKHEISSDRLKYLLEAPDSQNALKDLFVISNKVMICDNCKNEVIKVIKNKAKQEANKYKKQIEYNLASRIGLEIN